VATNKNPFDWKSNEQNRSPDLLKKIEFLIENEEFEDARSLLNILIPDDSDLFKKNLIEKMDEIIQDSHDDEEFRDDYYDFAAFDGTDPQPYYDLDKKLLYGIASDNEIRDLYMFWSAYPSHKTESYCVKMFKWLIENNCSCSSDLATYIIDTRKNPSIACFYYVLSKKRGFFEEVDQIAEHYEEFFDSEFIYVAEIEYKAYAKSKQLPELFSLENNTKD
jgi:hypothetical protein